MPMEGQRCIYCGSQVRAVRKGEHIVPESLGCVLALRCVCGKCNNEMSGIDKELVSQTPLHIIASQALDKSSDGVWDYEAGYDLALEARVVEQFTSPVLWPQVVFDERGPMFWFDLEEGRQVGERQYIKTFVEVLRTARNTLRNAHKRPRWVWMSLTHPPRRGRFPPRVFTPHTYPELSNRIHFICRYVKPVDKNRILWSLDNWRPFEGRLKLEERLGASDPEAQMSYSSRNVLRALVKIGVNLLAHICQTTPVNKDSFREAIGFARYDEGAAPSLKDYGFAWNTDVARLECPQNAHKFRLTYDRNWALDCAFFGGRIGATVAFAGPNHEKWRRVEIVMPLGSPDWEVKTSPIILVRVMHAEWCDLSLIAPSLPVKNLQHRFRVERRTREGPRA